MWRALTAFIMLDAGREVRHRVGTMGIIGAAGICGMLAMLFALQAAQRQLERMMSPPMASLTVAAGLLVLASLILLVAWLRQRRNRTGADIGTAMLATVPLANAVVQRINPQVLIAAAVLAGATMIGNRLGRKD
ncbi:MAG: hypothetical protein CFE31_02640 [Rhizobiales bacterium PAR1]|nr:MAG: hypothetical protein CFE31_02640 [Rhizobiales bacterium PAR1]